MKTFLTLSESADQLGLTERTLRRYIAAGDLPAYRVGQRQIRIKVTDLEKLLTPIPAGGRR